MPNSNLIPTDNKEILLNDLLNAAVAGGVALAAEQIYVNYDNLASLATIPDDCDFAIVQIVANDSAELTERKKAIAFKEHSTEATADVVRDTGFVAGDLGVIQINKSSLEGFRAVGRFNNGFSHELRVHYYQYAH